MRILVFMKDEVMGNTDEDSEMNMMDKESVLLMNHMI